MRYRVRASSGADVTAGCSPASEAIHHLPQGTVVVCAETYDERMRISSPAGWLSVGDLEPAEPAPSLTLDYEVFKDCHRSIAPGDHYGLDFPISVDLLRDFGAEFLTTAFRAAGTISADNRVTEIVELKPIVLLGASESAFLTVAYALPEPGLHTELFAKFPPPATDYKFGLSVMSHGEVEMARLSSRRNLPMPVAKSYFADYCSGTTNYILITERIAYGVAPIEPAYRKGRDHLIPDIRDHYRVLAKALGRLVAAHKTGSLGYDLENMFPFARAARNFHPIETPEINIDRLIDFIGRIAPQLFPAGATTAEFLKQWREDLLFGLANKDTVVTYLHAEVDYTGLCHPNLNIDNAWYWRDASGALQVGLIDWGGAGQMSIAQAICGMLMMPDPDMYLELRRDVMATFIAEYAAKGGLLLDADELLFQYKAAIFSVAIGIIVTVVAGYLPGFPEDDYKAMKNRYDPRLQDSGLASAIVWIDVLLREWLEDVTPGDACRRIVAQSA
jgi:hypothetical protein